MSAQKKKPRETLFPLPHNRKEQPTDANVLLHAICIAIRDNSSHKKLREIIAHLPKIMNRVTPYNAEQHHFVELEAENLELKAALLEAASKFKKLEKNIERLSALEVKATDTPTESQQV